MLPCPAGFASFRKRNIDSRWWEDFPFSLSLHSHLFQCLMRISVASWYRLFFYPTPLSCAIQNTHSRARKKAVLVFARKNAFLYIKELPFLYTGIFSAFCHWYPHPYALPSSLLFFRIHSCVLFPFLLTPGSDIIFTGRKHSFRTPSFDCAPETYPYTRKRRCILHSRATLLFCATSLSPSPLHFARGFSLAGIVSLPNSASFILEGS